jgi:hypothetical protein
MLVWIWKFHLTKHNGALKTSWKGTRFWPIILNDLGYRDAPSLDQRSHSRRDQVDMSKHMLNLTHAIGLRYTDNHYVGVGVGVPISCLLSDQYAVINELWMGALINYSATSKLKATY